MIKALVIVDMQNDFVTGTLPVPDSEQLVKPIVQLAGHFDEVITTQDWHPKDHVSFVEQGGPFVEHCVKFTKGAELVPSIAAIGAEPCVKGYEKDDEPAMDAFGGVMYRQARGLAEYLKLREVEKLVIVGVAQEFCVADTAIGGVLAGFDVAVPLAYTQALDPKAGKRSVERMLAARITVV